MATPTVLKDGRYKLMRKLGAGSQGETYEAQATQTVRKPAPGGLADEWKRYVARAGRGETPSSHELVAIKRFHVGSAKAWKDVELAEREATTLASLAHPNLPRYVEHFEEDGALYLVMEMVEGESLAALRSQRKVSSVAEVTRMMQDIGAALGYLHGRAPCVVHRDIKPGNILRRPDGSYALVDFGAVRDRLKPEGGSTVVGTFGYMAPEQFQGRASPKSDLYGLAATALVMLTGSEPEDLPHVGLGIDVERAVPSGTPKPLVRALASMLLPDPDARASSIDDALATLNDTRGRSKPPKAEKKRSGKREARREAKRAAAQLKRWRRGTVRPRRAPFVPRVIARLALLIASIVVWATVGIVVPLLLTILSFVFGRRLQRAAEACMDASARARSSLRVRVDSAPDSERVRVAVDEPASEEDEEDEEEELRRRSKIR